MGPISIEDAIRIAADGDAVLFAGAGVGFLIDGPNGKLPDGSKLSNRILGRPDESPAQPLDKAVGYTIRKGPGVEHVFDTLRSNLTVESVEPGLAAVFSLPWRRIYTTNYDDAIEQSRSGKQPTNYCVLESSTDKARIGTVVHINGKLSEVSPASIDKSLSLSDRSYAGRNLERSPWFSYLAHDLETARAVIFVGYSLYDLDISRLIFSSDIADKVFFFVSPDIDEVDKETLQQYGQIPDGGAINLIDKVRTTLQDYIPAKTRTYTNLRAIRPAKSPPVIEPSRVLDAQLVFGVLPEQQVISGTHVFGDRPFIVRREQELESQRKLRNGLYRDLLITGEFVSGKSSTTLSILADFVRQGYRAYFAVHGNTLADELADLASVDDRIVVVFEGYSAFRRTIREYARLRKPLQRMILTEQAVQHETYGDFIYEGVFGAQILEVELDRITEGDALQFAELVDFGGYWRERSGGSDETNARYISGQLDGSIYKLLTEIVDSKDVQQRIDKLLNPILNDRRATEVFVAACIVNVLGVPFRISDWVSVFDIHYVKGVLRRYDDELKYFLFVQSGNVFPRSGLLSASILRRVPERGLLVDAALKLFTAAARAKQPFDMYDSVYFQLGLFNRLQPIMDGPNQEELIFRFYEQIRPIENTHKNADYWLQLGIAATVFGELSVAADAFENAYARERKKDRPNFKKLDNYYNRFLLKYAASLDDSQDAYELFLKATEGLTKQMFQDDTRHYPFKSGRMYGEIARKHFANWRPDQQGRFIKETEAIRKRAIEYEQSYKGKHFDVEFLIRETGDLLNKLAPAATG